MDPKDINSLEEILKIAKKLGEDVKAMRAAAIATVTAPVCNVVPGADADVDKTHGSFFGSIKEFMDEPSEPEAFWFGVVHAWSRIFKRTQAAFTSDYIKWIEAVLDTPVEEPEEVAKTIAHDFHYYQLGFYGMRAVQVVAVYIFRAEIIELLQYAGII